jgi:oligoribonuclease (3'-5' exoribonuclease)
MEIGSLEHLLKQKKKAMIMLNKWSGVLLNLNEGIKTICTHEKTATTTKSYEAGWDYVAEYHTTKTCLICGKEISKDIKYGNSFA